MKEKEYSTNCCNLLKIMVQVLKNYGTRRHVLDGSVYNTYTTLLLHILYILHLQFYTCYKYYTGKNTTNTTYTPGHTLYHWCTYYTYYKYYTGTDTTTTKDMDHIAQIHTSMNDPIVYLAVQLNILICAPCLLVITDTHYLLSNNHLARLDQCG